MNGNHISNICYNMLQLYVPLFFGNSCRWAASQRLLLLEAMEIGLQVLSLNSMFFPVLPLSISICSTKRGFRPILEPGKSCSSNLFCQSFPSHGTSSWNRHFPQQDHILDQFDGEMLEPAAPSSVPVQILIGMCDMSQNWIFKYFQYPKTFPLQHWTCMGRLQKKSYESLLRL